MFKSQSEENSPLYVLNNQRGVTSITVAMLGVVLIGMAAFAIDIGHAVVTRGELQNAADAAALPAGTTMGMTYYNLPAAEQQDENRVLTADEKENVLAAAIAAALDNGASDLDSLNLAGDDIQVGNWNKDTKEFTTNGLTRPNSIQVTVRRDEAQNGPISTFFAGVLGVHELSLSMTATAALDTASGPSEPGEADVPFAISDEWFNGGAQCNDEIKFYPTNENGCAAWHAFDDSSHSRDTISDIITGLIDGDYESPGIIPGETQFEFTGGGRGEDLYGPGSALFREAR